MFKVNSLKEARRWFDHHKGGTVVCVNKSACVDQEVSSYEQALEFWKRDLMSKKKLDRMMGSLISMENGIEKSEKQIINITNILQQSNMPSILDIFPDAINNLKKVITNEEENIARLNENIRGIIRNNPQLEPYWILHKLTK